MITASHYSLSRPRTLKFAAESTISAVALITGWSAGLFPGAAPSYLPLPSATIGLTLVLLCLCGMTLYSMTRRKRQECLLIVGTDDLARELGRTLTENGIAEQDHVTISCDQLNALSIKKGATRIVVADSDPSECQQLATALIDCKLRGVAVEEAASFHETLTGKLWLNRLKTEWWMYSDGFQPSRVYLWRKRMLDIACASLLILVTAPLLFLIAIWIKADSPGPAIFSQERVGLHGTTFTLYKFRSMKEDAEAQSGPTWAAAADDRVTSFGKLLRRFRLDELPQAFNVLRGDMSFAGPRPERPHFVNILTERIPYYGLRHYVKPGITGWAQVKYSYAASIEDTIEKLRYDLYYIKHMSLQQDMWVL